jgi:hypothetical protein
MREPGSEEGTLSGMRQLRGRLVAGTQSEGQAGPCRGAAQDDPMGGYGSNTHGKSARRGTASGVILSRGWWGWGGVCSPQGRLTRRSGRRPRCPRAPPRPGAARVPCSRGLGPRRGGSAISERTLCRSRAQPPLPPRGRQRAAARSTRSGRRRLQRGSPVTEVRRKPNSSPQRSAELRSPKRPAPHPAYRSAPLSPRPVAQSGERRAPRLLNRGGSRIRVCPLSLAEGEPGRPTEGGGGSGACLGRRWEGWGGAWGRPSAHH